MNVETGMAPQPQLYDLKKDPAQRNNLAAQMPEKVAQMQKRLEQLSGRKFTL